MKSLFTFLILFISIISPAQNRHHQTNPEEKILENLKRIEDLYISNLNFNDRRKAMRLMDETIQLIQLRNIEPVGIVSDEAFELLVEQVKETINEEKKTKLILSVIGDGMITARQLKTLLDNYSFEHYKVECIKQVYPYVFDKENMILVYQTIGNSIVKDELIEYLRKNF